MGKNFLILILGFIESVLFLLSEFKVIDYDVFEVLSIMVFGFFIFDDLITPILNLVPNLISYLQKFILMDEDDKLNTYYNSIINAQQSSNNKKDKNVKDNNPSNTETKSKNAVATEDDVLKLMLGNLQEIQQYYKLSKSQATHAFICAVVMCVIGVLFIIATILIVLFKSENLVTVIVPVIGSVTTEAIGVTIFFVYRKSLDQLNQYYNSLHDNERFLSIVHITSKMSNERQNDIYCEIIRSQLAQMNNTDTNCSKKDEKD